MFIGLSKKIIDSKNNSYAIGVQVNVNAIEYYEDKIIYFINGEILHVEEDFYIIETLIDDAIKKERVK